MKKILDTSAWYECRLPELKRLIYIYIYIYKVKVKFTFEQATKAQEDE